MSTQGPERRVTAIRWHRNPFVHMICASFQLFCSHRTSARSTNAPASMILLLCWLQVQGGWPITTAAQQSRSLTHLVDLTPDPGPPHVSRFYSFFVSSTTPDTLEQSSAQKPCGDRRRTIIPRVS